MEQFLKDQIVYGLKYLPVNLLKYPFIKKQNEETEKFRKEEFMCGVCHPTDDYETIKDANIGWVRFDMPFPFDKDGNVAENYIEYKNRCLEFQKNGIKVMCITSYPETFFEHGIDVTTPEGEKRLREVARFIITDLKGAISGIQVTNEMGMPHFTLPLNLTQAARFIAVQLEEMYPLRGDIIIGYNSAGPQADLHCKMLPFLKYCDYVGIDIYMGCFAPGFLWMFDALINFLWAMTRKPIILMEFGYISKGKTVTKDEKIQILQKYGANSEKDAKNNIEKFVDNLPEFMQNHVKLVCKNDPSRYFNLIFKSDYKTHIYKELPPITKIPGYDHSYEGQAKFYRDIFERFYKKPFMAGAFIYSYQDARSCHVCGQSDCPTETKWGIVERSGAPKPAYFAIKETLGRLNNK